MTSLLLGSIFAAILYFLYDYRRVNKRLRVVKEFLTKARTKIDEPVIELLQKGSIKLLKAEWLMDENESNVYLPKVTKAKVGFEVRQPLSAFNAKVKRDIATRMAERVKLSSLCMTVEVRYEHKYGARLENALRDVRDLGFQTHGKALDDILYGDNEAIAFQRASLRAVDAGDADDGLFGSGGFFGVGSAEPQAEPSSEPSFPSTSAAPSTGAPSGAPMSLQGGLREVFPWLSPASQPPPTPSPPPSPPWFRSRATTDSAPMRASVALSPEEPVSLANVQANVAPLAVQAQPMASQALPMAVGQPMAVTEPMAVAQPMAVTEPMAVAQPINDAPLLMGRVLTSSSPAAPPGGGGVQRPQRMLGRVRGLLSREHKPTQEELEQKAQRKKMEDEAALIAAATVHLEGGIAATGISVKIVDDLTRAITNADHAGVDPERISWAMSKLNGAQQQLEMARAQAATRLFDVFNVMQVDVFNVMQVDQVVPRELTQIDTREADAAIQSAQLVGFNPEQLNECIGKLAAAKQEQRRRQLLEQQARHFLNRALSETDPLLSACNPIVMQERIDQMRDLGLGNDPIVEQAERKLVEVRMAHAEVAKLQQQLVDAMRKVNMQVAGCNINVRKLMAAIRNVSAEPKLRGLREQAERELQAQQERARAYVRKVDHLRALHRDPTTTVEIQMHISSFMETELTPHGLQKCLQNALAEADAMFKWQSGALLADLLRGPSKPVGQVRITDDSGPAKHFLPRCQDLPEHAFAKGEEAAEAYTMQMRKCNVLSYGWKMGGQPDPDGSNLKAVRSRLALEEKDYMDGIGQKNPAVKSRASDRLLFVDYVSLPQKDYQDYRSDKDNEKFKEGLGQMGTLGGADAIRNPVHATPPCRRKKGAALSRAEGYGPPATDRLLPPPPLPSPPLPPLLLPILLLLLPTSHRSIGPSLCSLPAVCPFAGNLYASIAATAVLQLKDVASIDAVPEFYGCVVIAVNQETAKQLHADQTTDWSGFVGTTLDKLERSGDVEGRARASIVGYRLFPKVLAGEGNRLQVRFATEEQARWAIDPTNPSRVPALWTDSFYNSRPYDNRGWPTFETGCARTVEAHMYRNKNQPRRSYNADFDAAENMQRKLTNISDGLREIVSVTQDVGVVLNDTFEKLASDSVKFTGKGDNALTTSLLKKFNQDMEYVVVKEYWKNAAKELDTDEARLSKMELSMDMIQPDLAPATIYGRRKPWKRGSSKTKLHWTPSYEDPYEEPSSRKDPLPYAPKPHETKPHETKPHETKPRETKPHEAEQDEAEQHTTIDQRLTDGLPRAAGEPRSAVPTPKAVVLLTKASDDTNFGIEFTIKRDNYHTPVAIDSFHDPRSIAATSGLAVGDGVLSIDGDKIVSAEQASRLLLSAPVGTVVIEVDRSSPEPKKASFSEQPQKANSSPEPKEADDDRFKPGTKVYIKNSKRRTAQAFGGAVGDHTKLRQGEGQVPRAQDGRRPEAVLHLRSELEP